MKQYNLFISHSWKYTDAYEKLLNLLNQSGINFKNYSVPKDNPIENANTDTTLLHAIEQKMKPTSCVIILAGVYSTYSQWIDKEIYLAKKLNKKIIAIEPFGSEKTSTKVKDAADMCIKWNTKSLINAIELLTFFNN